MNTTNKFSYTAALGTAIITTITFAAAMFAIPISGANCPGNCAAYPYLNTFGQFPRDFVWMPLAILLTLGYAALMIAIHNHVPEEKKILSQAGLFLTLMSATILAADYFIQFSVVPMSLMHGETEGLAMLIQYNPHGVFLALEELGYILMSLSFFCMALALPARDRLEVAIRRVFFGGFGLVAAALVAIPILFGLTRDDRLEVIILSIDWFVLIINGFLLGRLFKKQRLDPPSS